MNISSPRFVQDVFFFAIFGLAAFFMWKIFAPFIGAVALAAIMVTACYPLYERILKRMPRNNSTLAALVSILLIVLIIVIPLVTLASLILREALSIYALFESSDSLSLVDAVGHIESFVQTVIPTFTFDTAGIIKQTASFVANNLVSLFAGTASTFFLSVIALIASYYFFKDGRDFTTYLVSLSPLRDADDSMILKRLGSAIRSVMLGTVLIALIQGMLTCIGLSVLGFDHAILWGSIAAIGALVPTVGTSIVLIPAILYLFVTGSHIAAIILIVWGVLAVGLIDNVLGPYLMSKGNSVHPFLILLSVLGGISLFGPIGFVLGPVIVSLFFVLLELYHSYFKKRDA